MMAANPCVETVAPLHALINGLKGSPGILDDIPSEIMSNLQLEFTKTLRNLDDHMGNLLCLATFAQIATGRTTTPQYQHGSEGQWLLNIKHFFGAKRGLKTLDLVVLRVILACSSSCNLRPQDATESIRLAITIADAIEPEQKQAWIASNSAKISKLREKAVKDGLYGGIQTMVCLTLFHTRRTFANYCLLGHCIFACTSPGAVAIIPATRLWSQNSSVEEQPRNIGVTIAGTHRTSWKVASCEFEIRFLNVISKISRTPENLLPASSRPLHLPR
jgi:hypothetical protein